MCTVNFCTPVWRTRARFRSKVDVFIPARQNVNLQIVPWPRRTRGPLSSRRGRRLLTRTCSVYFGRVWSISGVFGLFRAYSIYCGTFASADSRPSRFSQRMPITDSYLFGYFRKMSLITTIDSCTTYDTCTRNDLISYRNTHNL